MAVEFWLGNMLLPVTPKEYSLDYGNEMEIVRTTGKGDVCLAGYRRLRNISVSGFFPCRKYDFVNRGRFRASDPMDYVERIQKWIKQRKVIRLIITDDDSTKINARFYVENIQYQQSRESNGDIDYTITFREYRDTGVQWRTKTSSVAEIPRPQGNQQAKARSYTVQNGDYLIKIAREVYGDGSQWKKIYEANKSKIGGNPNLIYSGTVLTIP